MRQICTLSLRGVENYSCCGFFGSLPFSGSAELKYVSQYEDGKAAQVNKAMGSRTAAGLRPPAAICSYTGLTLLWDFSLSLPGHNYIFCLNKENVDYEVIVAQL